MLRNTDLKYEQEFFDFNNHDHIELLPLNSSSIRFLIVADLLLQLCQPIALFSQCCSFILKNGEKLEEQNKQEPELIKIYNKTLDDFFNKR